MRFHPGEIDTRLEPEQGDNDQWVKFFEKRKELKGKPNARADDWVRKNWKGVDVSIHSSATHSIRVLDLMFTPASSLIQACQECKDAGEITGCTTLAVGGKKCTPCGTIRYRPNCSWDKLYWQEYKRHVFNLDDALFNRLEARFQREKNSQNGQGSFQWLSHGLMPFQMNLQPCRVDRYISTIPPHHLPPCTPLFTSYFLRSLVIMLLKKQLFTHCDPLR